MTKGSLQVRLTEEVLKKKLHIDSLGYRAP